MSEHNVFGILGGAVAATWTTQTLRGAMQRMFPGWVPDALVDWAMVAAAAGISVGTWLAANVVSVVAEGPAEGVRLVSVGWMLGTAVGVASASGIISAERGSVLHSLASRPVDYNSAVAGMRSMFPSAADSPILQPRTANPLGRRT